MRDASRRVADPTFIAVDWGTSNARFTLVDGDGKSIAERSAPGISRLAGPEAIESACFETIQGWISPSSPLPVVMSGMVGSSLGWRVVPYLACPATVESIVGACERFSCRGVQFVIVPGVSTRRADGFPDAMRGEETQILIRLGVEPGQYCLPGTHSKWAHTANRAIAGFHTALTGELLELLGLHSVLLSPRRAPRAIVDEAYLAGVNASRHASMGLESLLFTVRSQQTVSTMKSSEAESYLGGLCIGFDVRSALTQFDRSQSVTLVGAAPIAALYAAAAEHYDWHTSTIDGQEAALGGLALIHAALFEGRNVL